MNQWTKDYISPEAAPTLHALFLERVNRTPDSVAYQYFDHSTRQWQSFTWQESLNAINRWRKALIASDITKGQMIGIMLRNCPEWIFLEQACMAQGIISVPLYPNDRPDNVSYITNETDLKLILIEDKLQWDIIIEASAEMTHSPQIISLLPIDSDSDQSKIPLKTAEDWLKPGDAESLPELPEIDPKSLSTIVYTSGTTGRPKGVMLSHWNILKNASSGIEAVAVYKEDLFLSFLPLSHTLERTVGYYIPVMTGASVAFCRSVPQLAEDLVTIKPTILISVPRIYERVYGKITHQVEQKSPIAKKLFELTASIGWEKFESEQGRKPAGWRMMLWPLLDKIVAQKILAKLGGRLRFTISGGAPLPERISKMFIAFGLRVLQGYGLTESSPIISVNQLARDFPSSIGLPLPEVEVRVDENNELQTKSDCVMLGYWNNEQATKDTMTDDGWLKTGDLAKFEGDHIYITGRIKEILVLSNGEKLPPVDMEIALTLDNLFEQAMVIGEGKPYLAAIIVLEQDHWEALAKSIGIPPDAPESLKNPEVKSLVMNKVTECMCDFPGYAQIRQVTLSLETWTDANFFLTAAMKVRRKTLMEHFKDDIEQMYSGH